MDQLTKLKRLRIQKDELLLTIRDKEKTKTKSVIYLVIFILLFGWMIALDPNPNVANDTDIMNESGAKFLKFVSGKFLLVSLVLMYRTYRINKEIRELEREYEEMKRGVGYLSN
jgi:uncharacterized membrane protein